MIEKFLYVCPKCGSYDSILTDEKGNITCSSCKTEYHFTKDFKLTSETKGKKETHSLKEWYEKIKDLSPPEPKDGSFPKTSGEKLRAKSKEAELFMELPAGMFHGFKGIRARLYKFEKIEDGILYLSNRRLLFRGKEDHEIKISELASVTIESHMVITDTKRGHAYSFEFLRESGKKWEDLIRTEVTEFYKGKKIREFHPRITFY